ncbi:hypothetical protein Hdeb2414_s0019g00541111 [Helianthus debilis subsp. tardiflorus]
MHSLGDKVRWPRKNDKPPATKDESKWCAYHGDSGHLTDECIALRKEIGYLLSKGYLKELLGRKKSRIKDPEKVPEKAPLPLADAQIIHFISGGSQQLRDMRRKQRWRIGTDLFELPSLPRKKSYTLMGMTMSTYMILIMMVWLLHYLYLTILFAGFSLMGKAQ